MRARSARSLAASAGLVLTLGQLTACTSGEDHPVSQQSTDSASALDGIVAQWRSTAAGYAGELPGAILVASQDGTTRELAVGRSRLSPEEPMQVDDRFGVGSITKTMVATVILQLEEEDVLELDDTVEEWLPGILTFGDKATIEDLLDHRSGIWDVTVHSDFDAGTDLTDERLQRLLAHPPTGPPDKATRYTNPGYWLLGKIIERATGHTLGNELHMRVFAPAGMTDTVLSNDLRQEPRLVRGYDASGDDITSGDYTAPWAAGGVVATAGDIVRFFDALFHEVVVSKDNLEDMTTPRGNLPGGWGYGLGVVLADSRCGGLIGHDGIIDGHHTLAFYNPDNDRTVVAFTNTSSDAGTEALFRLSLDAMCSP